METVLSAAEWLFDKAVELIIKLIELLWIALQWCFENWKFTLVVLVILSIIGAIVGKISRDLGKNVDVKIVNDMGGVNLGLMVPNATCKDYLTALYGLKGDYYTYEYMADSFEKDKSLTMEDLQKPGSMFRFTAIASTALVESIAMNPATMACDAEFKAERDVVGQKFKKYLESNVAPRLKKLTEEGRIN